MKFRVLSLTLLILIWQTSHAMQPNQLNSGYTIEQKQQLLNAAGALVLFGGCCAVAVLSRTPKVKAAEDLLRALEHKRCEQPLTEKEFDAHKAATNRISRFIKVRHTAAAFAGLSAIALELFTTKAITGTTVTNPPAYIIPFLSAAAAGACLSEARWREDKRNPNRGNVEAAPFYGLVLFTTLAAASLTDSLARDGI